MTSKESEIDNGPDGDSLVELLRAETDVGDVAALLTVPTVLVLVFLAPLPLRRSLAFEYADPSLVTAFASAYVHLEPSHLLANLATYGVVVPVAYALSVGGGHRGRFYTAFVTFLLAFPTVLAYLNLAIVRSAATYGFSGVTMAFVGYLLFSLAASLDARFDVGPERAIAPALFFLTVGVVAALSVRSVVPENGTVLLGTAGLVAAALLAALLYALSAYERSSGVATTLRTIAGTAGDAELLAVAVVVVAAFPLVAFPADPAVGGGQLNLYGHLLGYALGFIVTFATVEVTGRVGPTAT